MKSHIILASGSKIRARLLQEASLDFSSILPTFDESSYKTSVKYLALPEQAVSLAEQKALSISKNYIENLVVGADQICDLNGKPLSKPKNYKNALTQLHLLSGKIHFLHTAVAICRNGNTLWKYCESIKLTMHSLTDEEIRNYIKKDEPYESCGSYCYEKTGWKLFSHIHGGSRESILGLPVDILLNKLRDYDDI